MPQTPYDKCKSLVKECEEFHKDPFKTYTPRSWYYKWWYLPKCGKPDFDTLFAEANNKTYCLDVAHGRKVFNAIRFRDDCKAVKKSDKTIRKHVIQEKVSWWDFFFSFWKAATEEAEEEAINLPLVQHKQVVREQIDSGHGLFFLVGSAFLLHRHPNVVVYDPFFNHRRDFDIRWFGRLVNLPGSYFLFNLLYSNLTLNMQFQKLNDPLRWVVKKDNFDQFKIRIDTEHKTMTVRVSSPILKSFTRTYSLEGADFVCFPLLVVLPNGIGHTTSLVYHLSKKTWEHFEPNGYIWYWADHMDDYLEAKVREWTDVPYAKFYRVKEITPAPCFQQLDRKGMIKGVDVAQYCATWTYWYLNVRLSNPNHTPPYIVRNIIRNVEEKEKRDTYIVFIRSFALVISRIIEELHAVFKSYYLKSWFSGYKTYQEKVREIFDYYIETYF